MKNGDKVWVQGEAGHADALIGKTPVTFASGIRCWFKSEGLTPCEGKMIVDARKIEALRDACAKALIWFEEWPKGSAFVKTEVVVRALRAALENESTQ